MGYSPWGCKMSDTTEGGWGDGCGEFLGITFCPLEILNHTNTLLTQRLNFLKIPYILFVAMVTGIVSLSSLSVFSLLVYKNAEISVC